MNKKMTEEIKYLNVNELKPFEEHVPSQQK